MCPASTRKSLQCTYRFRCRCFRCSMDSQGSRTPDRCQPNRRCSAPCKQSRWDSMAGPTSHTSGRSPTRKRRTSTRCPLSGTCCRHSIVRRLDHSRFRSHKRPRPCRRCQRSSTSVPPHRTSCNFRTRILCRLCICCPRSMDCPPLHNRYRPHKRSPTCIRHPDSTLAPQRRTMCRILKCTSCIAEYTCRRRSMARQWCHSTLLTHRGHPEPRKGMRDRWDSTACPGYRNFDRYPRNRRR